MRVRLIKKNPKTTDFVEIDTNEHLLTIRVGKIGRSGSRTTKHCSTSKNAIIEANKTITFYKEKKFIQVENIERNDNFNGVYDKAKWHFGGDFPKDLSVKESYTHTGLYIKWIIEKDLLSKHFYSETENGINLLKSEKISGPFFYQEYMDGVFIEEQLSDIGHQFTLFYFDFENGKYLDDYGNTLGPELDSLYYVKDTTENYNKLAPIIDKQFNKWKATKTKSEPLQH